MQPKTRHFPEELKNFSITRLRLLLELHNRGSLWNHELASALGLPPSPISDTLARMARGDEVRRTPALSDSNRAMFRYSITTKGRDLLKLVYHHATGKDLGNANHG